MVITLFLFKIFIYLFIWLPQLSVAACRIGSSLHHARSSLHHEGSSLHHAGSSLHHARSSLHHAGSSLHHAGSSLHHAGSSLHHEGSIFATHRLCSCSTQPSNCGTLVPEHMTSVAAARGLSFFAACGILVPQPETESMSPALQGRFLTTGPPE